MPFEDESSRGRYSGRMGCPERQMSACRAALLYVDADAPVL